MTKKGPKYLVPTPSEGKPSIPQKPIHLPTSISFRYIKEGEEYCLSLCDKKAIKAYLKALRLLTTMSWEKVIQTGGKPYGGKVSLGYTLRPDVKFKDVSEDITISSLRAGDRERFFGYRLNEIYYILAFDPKHDL